MKYTIVYQERGNGYNYRIRNENGLYAAAVSGAIRSWQSGSGAWNYIYNHMDNKCTWIVNPDDKPYVGGQPGLKAMRHTGMRPAVAAAYKSAHGGYPDCNPYGCVGNEFDFGVTCTGRISSSDSISTSSQFASKE